MTPSEKLVLIAPAYNENEYLPEFCAAWAEKLAGFNHIILIVDDGSTDNTAATMTTVMENYPTVKLITKKNSGHGAACRTGYEAALEWNATHVLQVDSDGQCDPHYFPEFWKNRNHTCVFGKRIHRGDGILRAITSRICQITTSIISGEHLIDPNCPYRLIQSEALQRALQQIPLDFDLQNVALTWALTRERTNSWYRVPIRFPQRAKGVNSINLRQVGKLGIHMLKQLANLKNIS